MKSDLLQQKGVERGERWTALELAEVKTPRRIGSIWQAKGASSRRRMKLEGRASCYHLMSRTVNGEFLFGATEKEAFRRMMWRMAAFSGVEVLTYAVMDNHFHILAKVPERESWLRKFDGAEGEERLLKHLGTLYSKKYLDQLGRELEGFRKQGNEEAATQLLEKFKRRFCDVSLFVKELKERFGRWFNKQQGRRGTLWMERFKSVLVDGEEALATMAAYIDLNPVRAGIVGDPAAYGWSGYGEACAGSRRAKRGLCKALNHPQHLWESKTMPRYRLFLFDEGAVVEPESSSHGKGKALRGGVKMEAKTRVEEEQGELPIPIKLRKRVPSFSNGVAMGRPEFVNEISKEYRKLMSRVRRSPGSFGEGESEWVVMRGGDF